MEPSVYLPKALLCMLLFAIATAAAAPAPSLPPQSREEEWVCLPADDLSVIEIGVKRLVGLVERQQQTIEALRKKLTEPSL